MTILPTLALCLAAVSPPQDARDALAAAFGPAAAQVAAIEYRLRVEDAAGQPVSDARYLLLPAPARLYREDADTRSWSDPASAWRWSRGQWESLGEAGRAPLRAHVAYNFFALLRDPAAGIERAGGARLRLAPAGHEAFEVELDAQGRIVRNLFADGTTVRELDYRAVQGGLQWPMRYEVLEQGEATRIGRFSDFRVAAATRCRRCRCRCRSRTWHARSPRPRPRPPACSAPAGCPARATTTTFRPMRPAARWCSRARTRISATRRILVARRAGEAWSEPTQAPFTDARYKDSDPWLTPDGRTLYFISNRPFDGEAARADLDLWRVAVTAAGFGKPEPLIALHGDAQELGPELHDGWLYFNSSRAGGPAPLSIWRARVEGAGFAAPEPLPATINFDRQQGDFTLSPDGRIAVFWSSDGKGDEGDLFAVRREGDGWSKAVRLPAPINSVAFEFTPSFSPDGRELRFTSTRKPAWLDVAAHVLNGQGNLYVVAVDTAKWWPRRDSNARPSP